MTKLFRISTVPLSLNVLLKGQLQFLSKYFDVTAVSGSGADLDTVRHREGVCTFPLELKRNISPVNDLVSLYKLYRLFKKEKPQIVHSITPKAGLLSMIAAKLAGVPIRMHTFTGLIFTSKTGMIKRILIWMDKILCYCATNIYPEGNGVKEDLVRYGITHKPLKVLANGNVNGIDVNFFNRELITLQQKAILKNELHISDQDFVFIFVGRLVKDKGINELVNAFSKIKREHVKLLLVGPLEQHLDPLLPETLAAIERDPQIISVGFQEDVRPYFSIAHALVFPSYREGFPNVVMQAGAMGLPSIVTDINGCNEIIIEGENGTIIPPKSAGVLLEAMKKLLDNENYLLHLGANARPLICNRYEQKVVWKALLEEYNCLKVNMK